MDREEFGGTEGFGPGDRTPVGLPTAWRDGEVWPPLPSLTATLAALTARMWDPVAEPKPIGAVQQAGRHAFVAATRRFRCDPSPEGFEEALRRLFPARHAGS